MQFDMFFSFLVSNNSCMSILGDTYGLESMSIDLQFDFF